MASPTIHALRRSLGQRTRSLASATALGAMLTACSGVGSDIVTPSTSLKSAPSTMRELTAPAQYKLWWDMTRACSGLSRDVSGVRWYTTADTALRTSADGASGIAGEWTASTNSIELVQAHVNDGSVVRHEMLHAFIVASGHPAEQFAGDCAGYVNCVGSCAAAVGVRPLAPASALRVTTDSLRITQRIFPARIDLSTDPDGWFALMVEATNARPYPVWVHLAKFPGRPSSAATFGYAALNMSQQDYVDGDSISFLPGETKRMIFDLKAKEYVANYRTTTIRGFFNASTLPAQTLNIVQ